MKKLVLIIATTIIFSCSTEDSPSGGSSRDFTKSYDDTLWLQSDTGEGPYYIKFSEDFLVQAGYPADQSYPAYCNIVTEGIHFDPDYDGDEVNFAVEIIENRGDILSILITDRDYPEYTTIVTFEFNNGTQLLKQSYQCLTDGVVESSGYDTQYYEQVPVDSFTFSNCREDEYEGC